MATTRKKKPAKKKLAKTIKGRNGGPRPGSGRPKKSIDWAIVETLAECWCTQEMIAARVGVSVDTLVRAAPEALGTGFAGYIKEKRENANSRLIQRMMVAAVEENNTTMQIFLAKNRLGMSDRVERKDSVAVKVDYEKESLRKILADPEAAALLAKLVKKVGG